MSVKKVNLSTSQGGVQLGLHAPLQEFPAGAGQQLPESIEAGGTKFKRHRLMRANVYVADSLPTENGYGTVEYTPISPEDYVKFNSPTHIIWATDCSNEEYLLAYVGANVEGIPHTPDGHKVWMTSGTVLGDNLMAEPVAGIQADQIKTPIGVHGRIIGHNTKFLFWSGLNPLDFVPSLHTGAGSAGHTADIGQIVQLIEGDDGFYVLGTRGALWATCTGDPTVPFSFSLIPNFSGVRPDSVVRRRYNAQNLLVLSNTGLCTLTPQSAQYDAFDNSQSIENTKRVLEIHSVTAALEGLVDAAEYIDSPDCEVTWLYYEKPCDPKCPVVANVSPNYATVSFGWDDSLQCFTRLLVQNLTLQRESVLHTNHTDVLDAKPGSGAEFILMSDGIPTEVRFGAGVGALVYHNLQRYSEDVICISKLSLSGRFETGLYKDPDLQVVRAQQGLDILDSYVEVLDLTRAVQREVQYAGRLRQRCVSLVVNWAGQLSGVTLEYA